MLKLTVIIIGLLIAIPLPPIGLLIVIIATNTLKG